MIAILFGLIFSLGESIIVYDAISLLAVRKKQTLARCVLLSVLTSSAMQFIPLKGFSAMLLIGAPIIQGLLAAKVLNVKVKYSILMALFGGLVIHTYDSLLIALLGVAIGEDVVLQMVLQTGWVRYLMGSVVKGTFLLIYIFVRRKIRKEHSFYNNQFGNNTLFVIVAGGFTGAIYLSYQMLSVFDRDVTISWIFFVFCLILAVLFFYFYVRQKLKENTTQFIEQRNHILEENYNNIKELYESNAKLFHDFKHHIKVIKRLAESGEDLELKEYLSNFHLPDSSVNIVKWTSDTTVNFILNSKLFVAEQKDINMTVNADYPLKTNISSNDITTILANLLDNAIEANEKNVEHKHIHVIIKPVNETLVIKIVNASEQEPITIGAGFLTSKEDKVHHGWGLKSVQSTVDKYGGFLDSEFHNQDKTFVVMVNLPFQLIHVN